MTVHSIAPQLTQAMNTARSNFAAHMVAAATPMPDVPQPVSLEPLVEPGDSDCVPDGTWQGPDGQAFDSNGEPVQPSNDTTDGPEWF